MTTRMMTARTKCHLMAQLGEKLFAKSFRLIGHQVRLVDGDLRTFLVFEVL